MKEATAAAASALKHASLYELYMVGGRLQKQLQRKSRPF